MSFERVARAVRHAPVLRDASPIWDRVRPAYNMVLARAFQNGLARIVNGTEHLRLDPRCRNVPMVYEPGVWSTLVGAVRPGDVFVDVGANVGLYAIAVARRIRPGRLIAFEPDSSNAELLRRNIALNDVGDVVEVRQLALGSEQGELPFRSAQQQSQFDPNGTTKVPLSTLDSEIDGRIDVLKIDVEGFEQEVVGGAQSILLDPARRPRTIFLETHTAVLRERGLDEASILDWLEYAGYRVAELSCDVSLTRNLVAHHP